MRVGSNGSSFDFDFSPFVPATAGVATGTAGSEQGTKRKRGGQSEDDDDDEIGAHGEGSNDAAPLCW